MKKTVLSYLIIATLTFVSCSSNEVRLLESVTSSGGYSTKYEYDSQYRIAKILTYDDGNHCVTRIFTYIGNDTIKVVEENINYPEESYSIEFVKNGNTITITDEGGMDKNYTSMKIVLPMVSVMYLDKNGLPTKLEMIQDNTSLTRTFQFKNGNLTKVSYKDIIRKSDVIVHNDGETRETVVAESESESEYKYDNKKSPFHYCKTPKWYLFYKWYFYEYDYGSRNNVLEESSSSEYRAGMVSDLHLDVTVHKKKYLLQYEYDDYGKHGLPTKSTAHYFGNAENEKTVIIMQYKYKKISDID